MAVVGERKQLVLQTATEAGFFDDGGDIGARQAAAKLNGAGLLARDPKKANLWYPTVSGLNELRVGVDDARALLASGDVMRARSLADVVYTQGQMMAKAAAGLNLRESLDACHRIQADALKISAHAQVRIADAWDDLAEAGKVAQRGRPKNVPDGNVFSAEQAGLDRKQIFHARQLRDKEKADPGFIDRVVDERIGDGLEPTRANLRAAIGTASASKDDRAENFYQTPEAATRTLLAFERFSETVWEPACGLGAISRVLEDAGYDVRMSDLVDRGATTQHGELQATGNFLHSVAGLDGPDIVTNPPYGEVLNDFVAHALRVHRPRKMALLLNLNFLCGFADEARNFVMDENPPARVYVFKRRLPMMHREGWTGAKASSRMNTAWFIWERQEDGSYGASTVVRRVDWAEFGGAEALAPGQGGRFGMASFVEVADESFERETPRKSLAERADEERERARAWMLAEGSFTRPALRQGIGVRDGVAALLIAELVEAGVIASGETEGVFEVAND